MNSARRLLLLGVAVLAASGCASTHRHPPLPLTIQLSAPRTFDVHVFVTPGAPTTACAVRIIEGTVHETRGDTLWFSRAVALARPGGAPDCIGGRAAYVDLQAHPDLRSQTSFIRTGPSIALVLFIGTFVALGTILAVIAGSA